MTQKNIAPAATILVRLAMLIGIQALFILALKSDSAAMLTERTMAGTLHYGPEPVHAAALLLGMVFLTIPKTADTIGTGTRSRRTTVIAGASWLAIAALSVFLTYPPAEIAAVFEDMDGANAGPAVAAAIRYSVIMAAMIPLAFILFPLSFLKRNGPALIFAFAALLAYMWLAVLRIALHRPLALFILDVSGTLLHMIDPTSSADPETLRLHSGPFSAVIGPQCLGLDGLVLFLCTWTVVWYLAARTRAVGTQRALIGLAAGLAALFLLNIVRIVFIMLVGRVWPDIGVDLFHGAAGAAFFLIVFISLLPLLRSKSR